jgi:hypothetical protein
MLQAEVLGGIASCVTHFYVLDFIEQNNILCLCKHAAISSAKHKHWGFEKRRFVIHNTNEGRNKENHFPAFVGVPAKIPATVIAYL